MPARRSFNRLVILAEDVASALGRAPTAAEQADNEAVAAAKRAYDEAVTARPITLG